MYLDWSPYPGPNGSGKSNILDAVAFALGEKNAKIMRADRLKSLIHDVEGSRGGTKIARATVHLDNADRSIPVDSDRVEITRILNTDGESAYYLNKQKTIRGRIQDMLEVVNAGLNQLNNVQQGTITRISEFSAEEKRGAIEDLIGLSAFDERKDQATKQLEQADRRLEVALAKMGEVRSRIGELEGGTEPRPAACHPVPGAGPLQHNPVTAEAGRREEPGRILGGESEQDWCQPARRYRPAGWHPGTHRVPGVGEAGLHGRGRHPRKGPAPA